MTIEKIKVEILKSLAEISDLNLMLVDNDIKKKYKDESVELVSINVICMILANELEDIKKLKKLFKFVKFNQILMIEIKQDDEDVRFYLDLIIKEFYKMLKKIKKVEK